MGGGGDDSGNSVQQTSDGGYIITGYTWPDGTDRSDVLLIKADASGNTLWTKTFGGSSEDRGNSVQQTTDGGYIVVGLTFSFGAGNTDVWLITTDASGDTLCTNTSGGSSVDRGNAAQLPSDGG